MEDRVVSGEERPRTVRLAGVQLETRNGEVEANLAHAERSAAAGTAAAPA